ncbi:MAG: CoA pyrophosphatase [Deltaproteobacteria bacterium]|nr:CoA pyrophosphatase [Deltaproteobacteria bacterium]
MQDLVLPGRFRANLARLAAREPFRLPVEEIPPGFRNSAVLVAFWPEERDVCVVLTRRSPKLAQHAGQTAFPGGRLDADESFPEAALREAQEEIGLDPRVVEIVGPLDDAWSGAGHVVVPVVGWLEQAPALRANPAEVAEILVARVSELLRPESRGTIEVVHRGVHYRNPTLRFRGGDVNGLSADLLLEAIGWGMGERPDPGPQRLAHLRTYFGGG